MKRFRRVESASTSNLTAKPAVKEGKLSKLKRISPNLFKFKNSPSAVNRRDKSDDVKSNKTNSESNRMNEIIYNLLYHHVNKK